MHIQKGAIEVSTVLITVILSNPATEEAETVEESMSVQHCTAESLTPTKQNTRERQSHLVCASPWLWSLTLNTTMNNTNTT